MTIICYIALNLSRGLRPSVYHIPTEEKSIVFLPLLRFWKDCFFTTFVTGNGVLVSSFNHTVQKKQMMHLRHCADDLLVPSSPDESLFCNFWIVIAQKTIFRVVLDFTAFIYVISIMKSVKNFSNCLPHIIPRFWERKRTSCRPHSIQVTHVIVDKNNITPQVHRNFLQYVI